MRLAVFMVICISCSVKVNLPSGGNDLASVINRATFVGYVVVNHSVSTRTKAVLSCKEVIKGYARSLQTDNIAILPLDNREYLVVVTETEGAISQFLYPVTATDRLSDNELQILNNVPCYSKELEDQYRNGVCTREYFPVCGCDSKLYGNACEAFTYGIAKFRIGECQ